MKNKELAELLGIEPKAYTESMRTGHCQTHTLFSLTYMDKNQLKPFGDFLYPDFEKPENFVKLLKLVLKVEGWCSNAVTFWDDNTVDIADITFTQKDKSIEENFIEAILKAVQEHLDNCDEWEEAREAEILLKSLKRQAQQTEWEY